MCVLLHFLFSVFQAPENYEIWKISEETLKGSFSCDFDAAEKPTDFQESLLILGKFLQLLQLSRGDY